MTPSRAASRLFVEGIGPFLKEIRKRMRVSTHRWMFSVDPFDRVMLVHSPHFDSLEPILAQVCVGNSSGFVFSGLASRAG
jgi:hypothetical protein